MLANFRTRPSEVLSQAVTSEFDPTSNPLMSLKARSFVVKFEPAASVVPSDVPLVWSYTDAGKFVVVDLDRLPISASTVFP